MCITICLNLKAGEYMESKTMYRILVATVFVLLMTIGIYIGLEITEEDVPVVEKVSVSNTNNIEVYDEPIEEIEELTDVDVKFTDIYPECGHTIESKEHESNTTKEKVRKQVEERDLGYRLVGEQEGILLYQKVHIGKCLNHYKVCIEEDVVTIYRMSENGEFVLYQVTEITTNMLREGIKEQLEEGIVVDDVEELFLLMEDIES